MPGGNKTEYTSKLCIPLLLLFQSNKFEAMYSLVRIIFTLYNRIMKYKKKK